MSRRFGRRFRVAPGMWLDISDPGSTTIGTRGLRYTIGRHGTRTAVGLPGSGISYSTYQRFLHHTTAPGKTLFWLGIGMLPARPLRRRAALNRNPKNGRRLSMIAIRHFWGQPENLMVLGEFDHELACRDAREDYVRVVAEGRRKAAPTGNSGRSAPGRRRRVMLASGSGAIRITAAGRRSPHIRIAYNACRWLLGLVK